LEQGRKAKFTGISGILDRLGRLSSPLLRQSHEKSVVIRWFGRYEDLSLFIVPEAKEIAYETADLPVTPRKPFSFPYLPFDRSF
jgi:hypothetical protein